MPEERSKQSSQAGSKLSFLPPGIIRSIGEYTVSSLAGAILLFAFFVLSEILVIALPDVNSIAVTFLPVICLMPIIGGAVSALALEKIRVKLLTPQRGALVGAFSSFLGATVSIIALSIVFLLNGKPFGTLIESPIFVVVSFFIIIAVDTVLGALGGALAVKFVKDI